MKDALNFHDCRWIIRFCTYVRSLLPDNASGFCFLTTVRNPFFFPVHRAVDKFLHDDYDYRSPITNRFSRYASSTVFDESRNRLVCARLTQKLPPSYASWESIIGNGETNRSVKRSAPSIAKLINRLFVDSRNRSFGYRGLLKYTEFNIAVEPSGKRVWEVPVWATRVPQSMWYRAIRENIDTSE